MKGHIYSGRRVNNRKKNELFSVFFLKKEVNIGSFWWRKKKNMRIQKKDKDKKKNERGVEENELFVEFVRIKFVREHVFWIWRVHECKTWYWSLQIHTHTHTLLLFNNFLLTLMFDMIAYFLLLIVVADKK